MGKIILPTIILPSGCVRTVSYSPFHNQAALSSGALRLSHLSRCFYSVNQAPRFRAVPAWRTARVQKTARAWQGTPHLNAQRSTHNL